MRKGVFFLVPLLFVSHGISAAQAPAELDTTTFVVMGEGLAAGLANFSLQEVFQKSSFPAVMARQMRTAFPQPLIQAPGLGSVPGYPALPVAVPGPGQTTARSLFPPTLFVFNLAVPGHRLADAIGLRPTPPLIQQGDPKLTLTNMVLGYPAMILGTDKPRWTQLEYAVAMNPTLVLVELGYTEALEAAVSGNPNLMPDPASFRSNYSQVLNTLQSTYAQIIATTIPDPIDTAYFNNAAAVTRLTGVSGEVLASRYGVKQGDLLSPNALVSIGVGETSLPAGSVVSAATAAAITSRVRGLNSEISTVSKQSGAILFDLNALFSRIRTSGLSVANTKLTADYLGGFYSLSGSYPGTTGQALIANEILALLNQTFQKSFPLVDLDSVAPTDPAVRYRPFVLPEVGK